MQLSVLPLEPEAVPIRIDIAYHSVQTHQQFADANGIATIRFLLEREFEDEAEAEVIATHAIRVLSNLCLTGTKSVHTFLMIA